MPTAAEMIRAHAAGGGGVAVQFEDEEWSYAQLAAAAAARAALLEGRPHVGVLLDNVPEFLFWLAAAAVSRSVIVGVNPTRRGAELERDIRSTDCAFLVTDREHAALVDRLDIGVAPSRVLVVDDPSYAELLAGVAGAPLPTVDAEPDDLYVLFFTSGAAGCTRPCRCSTRTPCSPASPRRGRSGRRSCCAGASRRRAGCRTSAATRRATSTTWASRSRTSWPRPSGPTTPTTRCASPSATRPIPGTSRRSPGASGASSSTATARQRAAHPSAGRRTRRRERSGRSRTTPGSSTRRPGRTARPPRSTPTAGCSTPRRPSVKSPPGRGRACSRGTTATPRPTPSGSTTGGTGPGTWPTGTPTGSCTSPGGATTGRASTGRTLRPPRSRQSSPATPTSCSSPPTRSPTPGSATR